MAAQNEKANPPRYEVVFYNDESTPFPFVAGLISKLTGIPTYKAEDLARKLERAGRHAFGPYTEPVADAIFSEATRAIGSAGHGMMVEKVDIADPNSAGVVVCSFCGKASSAVQKMFSGAHANICDECVVRGAGHLQELLSSARLQFTYELLDWHFGDVPLDTFVKTSRSYPGRVRADLQIAIERLFDDQAVRAVGFRQQHGYEKSDLTALWTSTPTT